MTRTLHTARLLLRPPTSDDATAIFTSYASDPDVTRFVAWPRHRTLDDTHHFLSFADAEWTNWPAGPLLIIANNTGELIGSTGLDFDSRDCASTGYVLAKKFWGQGYAVEALRAVINLADELRVQRLYALCHVEHTRSRRVLEKSAFTCEGILKRHLIFPNSDVAGAQDVYRYWVNTG